MGSLLQRAATYTVGGLLSQGIVFALWLLLPWFLPQQEVGAFALAMFALDLLSMLAVFGMDSSLIRFAGDENPRRRALLAAAVGNSTLAFVAVAALTVALAILAPACCGSTMAWVSGHLGLILLAVGVNVLWTLFQSGQVAARQASAYAGYQLARSILYFVVTLACVVLIEASAASVIGAALAASSLLLLTARARGGNDRVPVAFRDVATEFARLRAYGLPLMVYGVMGIAVTYTQRLLVDHYADLATLGVFAYFNVLALQINGLWGGLNKAWTPEYFSLVEHDQDRAQALMRGMLALLLIVYPALLALYVVFGELFLNAWLFPAAYREQVVLFYIMLLAPLFTGLYSVAYPLYYYDLRTRRLLVISLFLALANLAMAVVLTRLWGPKGTSLSFLLVAALTALVYLRAYPGWCGNGRLGLAMTSVAVISSASTLLLLDEGVPWLFAPALLLTSVLAWLLCGDLVQPLLGRLYKRGGAATCPPPADDAEKPADLLFYTDIMRTFRSSLIGYLHQACQTRRVVLLCEELDAETRRLLDDRSLFPGLVHIHPVAQYEAEAGSPVARHRRLASLARLLVDTWRPRVVFAAGVNVFEQYLRRYGCDLCGAKTVGCLGILLVTQPREVSMLLDLHAAETRFPLWLPRALRLAAVRMRRRLAQAYEYLLLPLLAGQRPFPGVNGIYRLDYTRTRGMDVAFVFTRQNQEMLVAAGVPRERMAFVPHPLQCRETAPVWRALGLALASQHPCPQVATCFLDIEPNWGFRAGDCEPIADAVLIDSRVRVIETLLAGLPGWEIRIKPHPMSVRSVLYAGVMQRMCDLSTRVRWLPPDDPADRHISQSGAIIGFPPASTAIFNAIVHNPGVAALQVDINQELRGDAYRGVRGVETITDLTALATCLESLRDGTWSGGVYPQDDGDFATFDALVEHLTKRSAV